MYSVAGIEVGITGLTSMVKGDFNGDGIPDFAAAGFACANGQGFPADSVAIYLGNHQSRFWRGSAVYRHRDKIVLKEKIGEDGLCVNYLSQVAPLILSKFQKTLTERHLLQPEFSILSSEVVKSISQHLHEATMSCAALLLLNAYEIIHPLHHSFSK